MISSQHPAYKRKGNTVYIKGSLTSVGLGKTLFTLPEGFRPLNTIRRTFIDTQGGQGWIGFGLFRLTVEINGNVNVMQCLYGQGSDTSTDVTLTKIKSGDNANMQINLYIDFPI